MSNLDKMNIELDIMNSNPEFNLISIGKETLEAEDMLQSYREGQEVQAERFLIKVDNDCVGIIEFCMCNPNDRKPWLGLLVIHKSHQRKGYAKQANRLFETFMKQRAVTEVRLGVISTNYGAIEFWRSIGYNKHSEKPCKGQIIWIFEKKLT